MKKCSLFFLLGLIVSCNNAENKNVITTTDSRLYTETDQPTFVPTDSANKMIGSYLRSIDSNETSLYSIIFNADSLRYMLNDTTGGTISNIKISFAHTLKYINDGGLDRPCGYTSGQLTVIISGFDQNGNYVFHPDNKVMNTGLPCPTSCPTGGTASSNLFPTSAL